MTWAILTGEYPPQPGGVSDYTSLVASGLAGMGERVHVWAPETAGPACEASGVEVHRLPGHFGPQALRQLDEDLERLNRPRRVLVEYVPHAFGWKAMNLPFCLWLTSRRDAIWSMFHEVAVPLVWNRPPTHHVLAVANTCMARLVARASERIFYSTAGWLPQLDRFAPATGKTWLPVPSNVAETANPAAVAAARTALLKGSGGSTGPGGAVIGHFGTYSPQSQELLMEVFTRLLQADEARSALFAGRGGCHFRDRFALRNPELADRVQALEAAGSETIPPYLAACDLLVQPYADGATTRRSSLMAGLALGKAIATNVGHLTEPLWEESGAVALAPDLLAPTIASIAEEILRNEAKMSQLGSRAAALYADRFALRHTLRTLLAQA